MTKLDEKTETLKFMKKYIIIGLALAGVINNVNAQSNTVTQAQIQIAAAKVNLAKVELQSFFFRQVQYGYGAQTQTGTALNTNAVTYIAPTVSALSGGMVTVSTNASTFIQANTLASAINVVGAPTRDYPTLTNNLAALNAGLAVCGQTTVQ